MKTACSCAPSSRDAVPPGASARSSVKCRSPPDARAPLSLAAACPLAWAGHIPGPRARRGSLHRGRRPPPCGIPPAFRLKGHTMSLSRRQVLAAGAAAAGLGATAYVAGTAEAASPPGDVVGKITVGYQGWFACPGDGAPINGWWHWSRERRPAAVAEQHARIVSWPDMREYTASYPTAYAEPRQRPAGHAVLVLRPADRRHPLPVDAADTAATRPRCSGSTRSAARARPATRWRPRSAPRPRRTGRKFYIMYDVTGWTNMQSEIKTDWTTKMSAYTRRRRTRGRTASRSCASGASASTTTTARSPPPPAWTSSTGSRARAAT